MISLSLRANITMCGSCVILTLPFHGLLLAMLIHDFDVINDAENELIF
jgi:hypothetical protein